MEIVGGLDLHRQQITFDVVDCGRGRCGGAGCGSRIGRGCGVGWSTRSVAGRRVGGSIWRWRVALAGGSSPRRSAPLASSRTSPIQPRCRPSVATSAAPRPIEPTPGCCASCSRRASCPSRGSRRRSCWSGASESGCTRRCSISARRGCSGPRRVVPARRVAARIQRRVGRDPGTGGQRRLDRRRPSTTGAWLQAYDASRRPAGAATGRADPLRPPPAACRALIVAHFGVGPLTAVAIWSELGDCRRFTRSDQAVRHSGLDVTVHRSDTKRAGGHLSRQGAPTLRWAAYEAGKSASRTGSPYRDYYRQVKDRQGGKRATMSAGRKILRRCYHTLRSLDPVDVYHDPATV